MQYRLIHSSDTHGWLYGHVHEPKENGTFGTVLTYIQKQKEQDPGNVLAFDSGDFVQGCGLSDATDPVGYFVNDMWKAQFQSGLFYDYITLGNHDLRTGSVEYLIDNILSDPIMKSRTVSLNVYQNGKLMASKYGKTKLGNMTVLVTGMMYYMTCDLNITINDANDTMKKDTEFLREVEEADIIILLPHMGMGSSLGMFYSMYEIIRDITPAPVIVMGGHEHQTKYTYPVHDKYFNSSFDFVLDEDGNDANLIFMETKNYFHELTLIDFDAVYDRTHQYYQLKNVKRTLVTVNTKDLNVTDLTPEAQAIEDQINAEISKLQLKKVAGVAPQDYLTPYDGCNDIYDTDCIYNLWLFTVVPDVLLKAQELPYEAVFIQGNSFFGTSIYKGNVTVDDLYITCPYKEEVFVSYCGIPGSTLKTFIKSLTKQYSTHTANEISGSYKYCLVMNDYDEKKLKNTMDKDGISRYKDDGCYTDYNAFTLYEAFVEQFWAK